MCCFRTLIAALRSTSDCRGIKNVVGLIKTEYDLEIVVRELIYPMTVSTEPWAAGAQRVVTQLALEHACLNSMCYGRRAAWGAAVDSPVVMRAKTVCSACTASLSLSNPLMVYFAPQRLETLMNILAWTWTLLNMHKWNMHGHF